MVAKFSDNGRSEPADVPVWDPFVRLAHWGLALAFLIAYLSADDDGPDNLHVWVGYAVGSVVVLRGLWGFIGPRRARFSDFVTGPFAALQYLFDLLRGQARRYLGHSPAGGVMVVALLACLAGTVATGLVAYGDRGRGPLAGAASIVSTAYADSEREGERGERPEGGESALGELHGALANLALALVLLHIAGVALASVAHRENLVAAMITGRKRPSR